jgi:prepilin-type processing-associated H-X9-DG protein
VKLEANVERTSRPVFGRVAAATRACVMVGAGLLATAAAAADVSGGAPVPQPGAAPLDEVQVVAQTLHQMQQRVEDIEDHFNEVYNQLNTRHEFDVHCVSQAPTMSNIRRRLCKPVYVDDAERAGTVAFLDGHAAPVADLVIQMRRDEYRRNLLEVVKRSPQLQQLLRERAEAAARYRRVAKERFKGGILVAE